MTDPLEHLRRGMSKSPAAPGDAVAESINELAGRIENLERTIRGNFDELVGLYADLSRKFQHLTAAFAMLAGEREAAAALMAGESDESGKVM
jgi:hypothetical protein